MNPLTRRDFIKSAFVSAAALAVDAALPGLGHAQTNAAAQANPDSFFDAACNTIVIDDHRLVAYEPLSPNENLVVALLEKTGKPQVTLYFDLLSEEMTRNGHLISSVQIDGKTHPYYVRFVHERTSGAFAFTSGRTGNALIDAQLKGKPVLEKDRLKAEILLCLVGAKRISDADCYGSMFMLHGALTHDGLPPEKENKNFMSVYRGVHFPNHTTYSIGEQVAGNDADGKALINSVSFVYRFPYFPQTGMHVSLKQKGTSWDAADAQEQIRAFLRDEIGLTDRQEIQDIQRATVKLLLLDKKAIDSTILSEDGKIDPAIIRDIAAADETLCAKFEKLYQSAQKPSHKQRLGLSRKALVG